MADENMVQNAVLPRGNEENAEENDMDTNEDLEICDEQEYASLNAQLDQLNSALDFIESKNENVRAELVELLKSNQETRRQIQESQNKDVTTTDGSK